VPTTPRLDGKSLPHRVQFLTCRAPASRCIQLFFIEDHHTLLASIDDQIVLLERAIIKQCIVFIVCSQQHT
jgi:hypothetical protein